MTEDYLRKSTKGGFERKNVLLASIKVQSESKGRKIGAEKRET